MFHVVWTSSTYEVYPAGKRPDQVQQQQAKAASGEGDTGEGEAGEDDVRPAENRATFRGVTFHPGYGEDEDELFAAGEEQEATVCEGRSRRSRALADPLGRTRST